MEGDKCESLKVFFRGWRIDFFLDLMQLECFNVLLFILFNIRKEHIALLYQRERERERDPLIILTHLSFLSES